MAENQENNHPPRPAPPNPPASSPRRLVGPFRTSTPRNLFMADNAGQSSSGRPQNPPADPPHCFVGPFRTATRRHLFMGEKFVAAAAAEKNLLPTVVGPSGPRGDEGTGGKLVGFHPSPDPPHCFVGPFRTATRRHLFMDERSVAAAAEKNFLPTVVGPSRPRGDEGTGGKFVGFHPSPDDILIEVPDDFDYDEIMRLLEGDSATEEQIVQSDPAANEIAGSNVPEPRFLNDDMAREEQTIQPYTAANKMSGNVSGAAASYAQFDTNINNNVSEPPMQQDYRRNNPQNVVQLSHQRLQGLNLDQLLQPSTLGKGKIPPRNPSPNSRPQTANKGKPPLYPSPRSKSSAPRSQTQSQVSKNAAANQWSPSSNVFQLQPGYGWVPVQSPNDADDAFPVWDPEQDKFKQDTPRPGSSSGQPRNLRRPIEAMDLDDNDEEEAPPQSSRAHPVHKLDPKRKKK